VTLYLPTPFDARTTPFADEVPDAPHPPSRCALLALEFEALLKDNNLSERSNDSTAKRLAFCLATEGRGTLWTA
jgi:hypothetical protein